MRVGIFSKFETAGGSERRCVEMANALVIYTNHEAWLLAEKDLPTSLEHSIDERVRTLKNVFNGDETRCEALYELDLLLVVNTDSKEFCREEYWLGQSQRHNTCVDLARMPRMVFLFNFIVSPSRFLDKLAVSIPKIGIITANRKFLNEIGEQERYCRIRHLPRIVLESPIDAQSINTAKRESPKVRVGMHSTSATDKWNSSWTELIANVNDRCGTDRIAWRFMGMPRRLREELGAFSNVEAKPEYAQPVREFLDDLDLFVFFTSWKREEAWSRSVAEALMSGCPVLAIPRGGNPDQIIQGNNGLLCDSIDRFVDGIVHLVQEPELRRRMGENAMIRARDYFSEAVIKRFVRFVEEAI